MYPSHLEVGLDGEAEVDVSDQLAVLSLAQHQVATGLTRRVFHPLLVVPAIAGLIHNILHVTLRELQDEAAQPGREGAAAGELHGEVQAVAVVLGERTESRQDVVIDSNVREKRVADAHEVLLRGGELRDRMLAEFCHRGGLGGVSGWWWCGA